MMGAISVNFNADTIISTNISKIQIPDAVLKIRNFILGLQIIESAYSGPPNLLQK